jgi:BON domain
MQRSLLMVLPHLLARILAACSNTDQSPDVTDSVRKSLDQAGYNDVRVSEDRDKGVVTLTGTVLTKSEKAQAESIAKSEAGSQAVANEIAVRPLGIESEAKAVDADLDKAIEKNAEAVLIKNRLKIRSQEWCADLNRRRVFAIAPGRGRKTFDGSAQRETGGERARG